MAVARMPASAIGVSKGRPGPSRHPSPSSAPVPCSSLPCSEPQFLPLTTKVPGHLLEDIVEHRRRAVVLAGAHRAIAFGLALGVTHLAIHLGRQMGMLLVRPRPECHQVCPQACDRIAKWPMGGLG